MKKITTLFATLCICGLSFSQSLFLDHFEYGSTGGFIVGITGSPWLANTSGGATNPIKYDATGSVIYGAYPAFGGKLNLVPNGQDITTPLADSVTSESVYALMLVNISAAQATGDYFFHYMPNVTTNSYFARLFVRLNGGNINFGLMKNNGGATPYSTIAYDLNKTYCLVLKYKFRPETVTDTASLYVFDASTGVPITEPGTPEMSIYANTDATTIGAIGVRQGAATAAATMSIDHIGVATTWIAMLQALPLDLRSFTCKALGNGTSIEWVAANEIRFDRYELEKSFNGKDFYNIATIKGTATAGRQATYQYIDAAPLAAKQYYRLAMVDKDGTKRYSQIIFRAAQTLLDVSVYPNPVSGIAVVSHPVIKAGASLRIISLDGKTIQTLAPASGATQTIFNATKLATGTYLLVATFEGQTTTVRFTKQ